MTFSLRDGLALSKLQHVVIVRFHRRRHVAVQDAVFVFALNLGIAFTLQVLDLVHEVVLSRERHVLETDGRGIIGEVVDSHCHRRCLGIVFRPAGNLVGVGLRGGGSRYRVRQLMGFHLQKIRVEYDFFTRIVQVVILRRDVVDRNLMEHGYDSHGAGYYRFCRNLGFRTLYDPLVEHLALDERILRHDTDGLAGLAEVLGKLLEDGFAVIIEHDETYFILVIELRGKRKIGCDLFATVVLSFTHEPADEVLALHCGRGGELQRVAGVVSVGLIDGLVVDLERHRENVLVVFSPDIGVLSDGHGIAEVAAAVHPLASVTRFFRHGRNVVQAVARVDVDGLGVDDRRLVFLIEGNRVGDFVVIRDDDGVFRGHVRAIDARTENADFRTLIALHDFANGPVRVVIFAGDGDRQLVANCSVSIYGNGCVRIRVAIIEVDGVLLHEFRRQRYVVFRHERADSDVGLSVEPAVEAVAFFAYGGQRDCFASFDGYGRWRLHIFFGYERDGVLSHFAVAVAVAIVFPGFGRIGGGQRVFVGGGQLLVHGSRNARHARFTVVGCSNNVFDS